MTTDWSDFGRKFVRRISKIKNFVRRQTTGSTGSPDTSGLEDSQANMIKASENGELANFGSQSIDIGKQQVGKVYAKALLAATEKSGSDTVVAELGAMVGELFRKAPRFEEALASPRVTVPEKLQLIDSTLNGRVSNELLRFVKVVCEHGRLDSLKDIYFAARTMLNRKKGIIQVQMVTAEPVDTGLVEQVRQSLKQKLGSDVEVSTSIDPKLLGGVLIRVGDKVYDGSVARKLELLRDQAVEKTVSQMRETASRFAAES